MPGLEEIGDGTGERKLLLRRSVLNIRVGQLYKADFETRNLRKIRKLSNRVCNEAKTAPVELLGMLVSAFDKLCERERILLRIPLPAAAKSSEPRTIPGRTSASLVVREPIEAGPAPKSSAQPYPKSDGNSDTTTAH